MKKVYIILSFLLSLHCFSQSIVVSTTKTAEQLVNDVLLKNPPCNSNPNTTWRTGTASGVNGIGYFENTNPNFPLKSGVILSTGSVMSAKGPNVQPELSEGTNSWSGDAGLENIILSNLGITMISKNATVLEFDFTPLSSQFSFDFVFASEEYGNGQCQNFSDAFAFLLTNTVTGVTTNLAVVPNSNIPLSVATVRDKSYNSLCTDENSDYFGRFNGGSNADNSATNFNGQTALLKAIATLTINQKYHLKLVVADGNDFKYDSAVFIDGESFSIGKSVLGDDVLSTNTNSPCFNTPYVLNSGLNTAVYSAISWSKNGLPIPGQTGSTLSITGSGTYAITFTAPGCVPLTDEVLVEYQPQIITENPIDLFNCSDSSNPNLFDLSLNTDFLKTRLNPLPVLDPSIEVTYHNSYAEASNNSNPLPKLYTSALNPEIIYARIKASENNCYIIKDFKLSIAPPALANKPADLINCSETNTFKFDLTIQDPTILNGLSPTIFSVKYFTTQTDATSDQNEILTPKIYSSVDKAIFARVENKTNLKCSISTTSFSIKVNVKPSVTAVSSITTCGNYKLPVIANGEYYTQANGGGTKLAPATVINTTKTIHIYKKDPVTGCFTNKSFIVTIVTDLLPPSFANCGPYKLPSLVLGKYYTKDNGLGAVIPVGTDITTTTTVYAFYDSGSCALRDQYTITINPQIQLANPPNIFECASYTLPPLPPVPVGSTINYYTEKDGPNGSGTILNAGATITTRQKIYIYGIAGICPTEKSFEVIIGNLKDIKECRPYTLPPLPIGGYFSQANGQDEIPAATIIKETQDIYFYVASNSCTNNFKFNVEIEQPIVDELEPVTICGQFILPVLTNGEYFTRANGAGTKLNAGDAIRKTQTIYIFKASANLICNNDWPFVITVNPIPKIDARGSVDSCDDYELSPLKNGKYYNGTHLDGGTPELLDPAIKISETQTIYIYAASEFCSDEGSFVITIHKPKIDQPKDVTSCVNYPLPPIPVGDYYTKSGGPNAIGGNTKLLAGTIINTSATLFIYAESNTRNNCSNEKFFQITIVPEPIATSVPISESTYCDEDGVNDGITNVDLTQLNGTVLGSQISPEFKVEYFASLSDATLGNNPFLASSLTTVFAKVTNTLTINSCFDVTGPINIIINKLPEPTPVAGIICFDNKTNALVSSYTIDSRLSANDYTFEWQNESGVIVGTNYNYEALLPSLYTVVATNKLTGCSSPKIPASVIASEDAILSYKTPDEFTIHPNLTIIADGIGDYEYQLKDGPFQDSAVFSDLGSGTYTITVRDKNGCGISSIEATIINFPRFFTPNGDSINDKWELSNLKDLDNVKVQIFNRNGKFLGNVIPDEKGWDGTFNGEKLPSTDYWFTITYEKDGVLKIFRSHFSLKR